MQANKTVLVCARFIWFYTAFFFFLNHTRTFIISAWQQLESDSSMYCFKGWGIIKSSVRHTATQISINCHIRENTLLLPKLFPYL